MVVQRLALSPHGKKVEGFESRLWPFCGEFACSPCAYVGFLWALRFPQSKNMLVR